MTPGRTRQARVRARRWGEGERQVTVWLDSTALTRLAALRQPGEHASDVVRRALQALAVEHNRAVEEEVRDLEERHRAMQEIVRAMYYEAGLKPREIARQMNKAGVPTGAPGGRWDEDTVAGFLARSACSDWSVINSRLTPVP